MLISNKRLTIILISVGCLLLVPLVAMQFTTEVNWSPMDFLVMGVLLLGTGLGFELIMRKVKSKEKRVLLLGAILLAFLLLWAEMAVGIFGSPIAGS